MATVIENLIRIFAPEQNAVREWVSGLREENPTMNPDQMAAYICRRLVWQSTMEGAALGLPGAVPGLGTVVQAGISLGTTSADLTLLIRHQVYLTFSIAECYGVAEQRCLLQDVLILIGLWSNALTLTKSGAIRMGTKIVAANFNKRVSAEVFKAINKKVGTTVLTKYGTKRGGIAVGRLIPFGVGVLVGGTLNYIMMNRFADHTCRYFGRAQVGR